MAGSLLGQRASLVSFLCPLAAQLNTYSMRNRSLTRQYKFANAITVALVLLGAFLPMHPAMRRVVDKPTDSPDPAVYR